MTIVGLQVLDEGVHVLILFLVLDILLGRNILRRLLIELSALNVGRQRRSAGGRVLGHWRGLLRQIKLCAGLCCRRVVVRGKGRSEIGAN